MIDRAGKEILDALANLQRVLANENLEREFTIGLGPKATERLLTVALRGDYSLPIYEAPTVAIALPYAPAGVLSPSRKPGE